MKQKISLIFLALFLLTGCSLPSTITSMEKTNLQAVPTTTTTNSFESNLVTDKTTASSPSPTTTPQVGNSAVTPPRATTAVPSAVTSNAIPVLPSPAGALDVSIRIGGRDGEVIRPLLGVNGGPLPAGRNPANADLTDAYQRIGVNMIRTHDYYGPLDMGEIYPNQNADPFNPASYHFENSDIVFRSILAGGFEPYLRLGDSWNVRGLQQRTPENTENWLQAALVVVRRYFEISTDSGIPLRYVEMWNEPDNKQFWNGTQQEFNTLFAQTATVLKSAFPVLQIGGPGFTPAGALTPKGRANTINFLAYLQNHQVPMDFLSWHIYANEPQQYADAAAFYRKQLEAYGYVQAESHITEWNTAVKQSRDPNAADLRYTARGAAILSAAWIALQKQPVDVSTFYRGPDPDINAPHFYGMFYADGRPKPIALAFSLWSQLAQHSFRLTVETSKENNLWLLAGESDHKEIALLIANPSSDLVASQIILPERFTQSTATVQLISDSSDSIQTFRAVPIVEIPPNSIMLFNWSP